MSQRARPSTDDIGTAKRVPAPFDAALPAPPHGSAEAVDAFEGDATEVNPRQGLAAVEQPTPTEIDPSAPSPPSVPTAIAARPERSEPIRVISMKDPTEGQQPKPEPRVPLHVQLRTLAQVSGSHDVQPGLGHLAPPRDPARKRDRRIGNQIARACVALLLAGTIALAIWFVFGR
jgi:hypothetical protein